MPYRINLTDLMERRALGKDIHYGPTPKVGDFILGINAKVTKVRLGDVDDVEAHGQ